MRAHLYNAEGLPPLVNDGLGYTGEQWQTDDTLWQRHHFSQLADTLYLETGFYNYQTLEEIGDMLRLPVEENQRTENGTRKTG